MNDKPEPQSQPGVNPAAAEKLALRSAQLLWDLSNAEAELDRLRGENARLHEQLSELLKALSTPQEAAGGPQTPPEGEGGGNDGPEAQEGS